MASQFPLTLTKRPLRISSIRSGLLLYHGMEPPTVFLLLGALRNSPYVKFVGSKLVLSFYKE